MPRALNRGGRYGWSKSMCNTSRVLTEEYKEKFGKIKWNDHDSSEWEITRIPGERGGIGIKKTF